MIGRFLTDGKFSGKIKLILLLVMILTAGSVLSNYFYNRYLNRTVKESLITHTLPLAIDSACSSAIELIGPAETKSPGKNIRSRLMSENTLIDNISVHLGKIQEKYNCLVYIVDKDGIVICHPNKKLSGIADIHKLKGISDSADDILSQKSYSSAYEFRIDENEAILLTSFREECNLYIFAEFRIDLTRNSSFSLRLLGIFTSLLMSLAVTLLFILTINHYLNRIQYITATDELTGANTRREFDLQFRKSAYNFNRNGTPFSLILFDIDNLKNINDRMGHITGDSSIKTIASIARNAMRLTDVLVRWGGDEFIILTDGNEENAMRAAERIRKNVETSDFFTKYHDRQNSESDVTISCGVSGFRKGDTLDSLLSRADAALNRAKIEGRNRIYRG